MRGEQLKYQGSSNTLQHLIFNKMPHFNVIAQWLSLQGGKAGFAESGMISMGTLQESLVLSRKHIKSYSLLNPCTVYRDALRKLLNLECSTGIHITINMVDSMANIPLAEREESLFILDGSREFNNHTTAHEITALHTHPGRSFHGSL